MSLLSSCWQDMPVCDLANSHSLTQEISEKISVIHQKIDKSSLKSRACSINSSELAITHA